MLCLHQEERRTALVARLRSLAPFLAGLLCTLLIGYGAYTITRPAELQVHFLDVGQGDAALVITPHRRAFMVYTGGKCDDRLDAGILSFALKNLLINVIIKP